MNGLPYYKAYPRDFFEGTIGMPFELKSGYRLLLDLIYLQGGRLPDDARYISGLMGCSVRAWKSIRERLIAAGKIVVKDGIISNFRADKELESLAKLQERQRENASGPRKINEIQKPRHRHTEPDTDTDKKEKKDIGAAVAACLVEAGASEQSVTSFIAYRRKHKSKGLTETGARRLATHLRSIFDSGGDPSDALAMAEERGWASVEPDWYFKESRKKPNGTLNEGWARALDNARRRDAANGRMADGAGPDPDVPLLGEDDGPGGNRDGSGGLGGGVARFPAIGRL